MPARAMPQVPTERRISLAEVYNVRDLGGYPCETGRQVRWGTVFRADGLHRARGQDLERLRVLGLRTVIDLRTPQEVARGHVSVSSIGAERFHHLPLMASWEGPLSASAVADPARALCERYLDMLEEGAPAVVVALRVMADPTAHPLVFHCAAGKDRTGVLAAVLLSLLGVPDAEVASDYAMSAAAVGRMLSYLMSAAADGAGEFPIIPDWLLSAPADAILATLEGLRRRYGSVADYCRSVGLPDEALYRLVELLTEPRDQVGSGGLTSAHSRR